MIRYNRKLNVFLFFAIFFQSFSSRAQYAPEKMKGGLFVENKGQWDDNVLYRAEIPSGQLYIEKNRFLFNFYDAAAMASHHAHVYDDVSINTSNQRTGIAEPSKPNLVQAHVYEVAFLGCNMITSTSGINPQSNTYNYFKGDDKSKWGSGAKAYNQTIIHEIYPNTNLVCFGQETGFKYEFHLTAGTDPALIQMKYSGADSVYLKNGELFIKTSVIDLYEQKPFAYQEINGKRIHVPCQFKLVNNILSFIFPKGYNKKHPLVIDPQLIFSTYSGSTADNWGNSATYDDDGNTYMVGIAFDQGYRTTPGAYQRLYRGSTEYVYFRSDTIEKSDPDVAIMKFDPYGKLLYATYLGGTEAEVPSSCIVNNKKELVIFGFTGSDGLMGNMLKFPTTADAYDRTFNGGVPVAPLTVFDGIFFDRGSDLFITCLHENGGSITHSTLLGGSNNDGMTYTNDVLTQNYGDQFRGEIYSDEFDDIYIITKTFSSNIINTSVPGYDKTYNGNVDAYLCKLPGDLSKILWNTYWGGSQRDAGYSIRVAADKSVYITGGTTSINLPGTSSGLKPSMTDGDLDGYIAHFSADGNSLLHATYLGTDSFDQGFFIQLDAAENIYIFGQTLGNYPMSPGVYGQPNTGQFIQKIDPTLSTSLLSTTIGNNPNAISIVPTAFLVNKCDNILLSGWGGYVNKSPYAGGDTYNMDTSPDAHYPTTDGSDFYLMVMEKNFNSLLYATYYGGEGEDDHVDGGTSRFDKNGIIYQSVCASCNTKGFSTAKFPLTSDAIKKGSLKCNNACFKYDLSRLRADFIMDPIKGCGSTTVTLTNTSNGGMSFEWDLGDGTKVAGYNGPFKHYYPNPGTYIIKLIAIDLTTCIGRDTTEKVLTIYPNVSIDNNLSNTRICRGDTISALKNCNPDYNYSWSPNTEVINANTCDALFYPSATRSYYLHVTDQNGCELRDTINIDVANLVAGVSWENLTTCKGKPTVRLSNPSTGALNYFWSFGDGHTSKEVSPVHEYNEGGTYPVAVDVYNDYCALTATGTVKIDAINVPNLFTPNGDTKNDCFEIVGLYPGWHVEIYNAWSKNIFKSDSYKNEFCGDNVSSGVYYYLVCAPYGDCCKSWVHIMQDK